MTWEQEIAREIELGILTPDRRPTTNFTITDRAHLDALLAHLAAIQDDDEGAHILEDRIWEGTLRYIAAGAPDAQQLASRALDTTTFEFCRWHA